MFLQYVYHSAADIFRYSYHSRHKTACHKEGKGKQCTIESRSEEWLRNEMGE